MNARNASTKLRARRDEDRADRGDRGDHLRSEDLTRLTTRSTEADHIDQIGLVTDQTNIDQTIKVTVDLHFFGVYIPYFYAPLYTQVLGASPHTAFYISSALNASTFFGRLIMGIAADKIGSSNALVVSVVVSAVLSFAWQGVGSVAGMFVWTVIYGWFSGASISLQSPAMIPLVPGGDLRLIGPYIAILCQLSSFGSLGGNPIAGALLRARAQGNDGKDGIYQVEDFYPMMWFGGSVMLAAVLFYQFARYTHTPQLLSKK